MKISCLIIIFFAVFIFSCGHTQKENIETLLKHWHRKEILFPVYSIFTRGGKDTVDFDISGDFKVLTYVDSVGCVSCKLQLGRWKSFMEELNGSGLNPVKFLFFFSPERRKEFLGILKSENFTYPICIDEKNKLNELNNFPLAFHTFLLDKDNKVLAIGNPVHNPKVKELYLKIIRGEKTGRRNESKETRTKVEIGKTVVSLGSFSWQEEQEVTFVLRNTGDGLLVIQDVTTSCGCTTVDYPKEPAQPGKELALTVTYKADHPEHFDKTVTVHCNAEASPLVLRINGNAE